MTGFCAATIGVPGTDTPTRCALHASHVNEAGNRMHRGRDTGPGNVVREWLDGKPGDGRS